MNDRELDQRLLVALAMVRDGGQLARHHFERRDQLEIEDKSSGQDLVSIADRATEDLIRARLAATFPEDGILGEEGGATNMDAPGLWIIDPIDGTANFLRGMPYWSVTVAFMVARKTLIGVTYDPLRDELFWARRGHGAFRDGVPMRVSGCTDAGRAVIGSTYSFKLEIERYLKVVGGILGAGADHRRMGSTALMLAHTADGRLDACATPYCNSWDVVGGLILVEEAGGLVRQFLDGAELDQPTHVYGTTSELEPVVSNLLRAAMN